MGNTKGYKSWKNYHSNPSADSPKDVKEATRDLVQEAPKTAIPEETTKVVKLEKGSSALVTHESPKLSAHSISKK